MSSHFTVAFQVRVAAGTQGRVTLDAANVRAVMPAALALFVAGGGRLHALSPQSVLGRGYAMVRSEEGAVLSSVADAEVGRRVRIEVADGAWDARIEGVHGAAQS